MVTDGEIPAASEELLERLSGAREDLGLQVRVLVIAVLQSLDNARKLEHASSSLCVDTIRHGQYGT